MAGREANALRAQSPKIEAVKSEELPLSMEIQTAVRAELDAMLAAPFFVQSNRCKRFLRHIVLQTLSGKANQLKERMIGINVFDRAGDYDAGEDAIVRVTANDVRKRIGQFYQESPADHPIQIDLPRGTYVPEFRIHLASHLSPSQPTAAQGSASWESAGRGHSLPVEVPAASAPSPEETSGGTPRMVEAELPKRHHSRKVWFALALLLLTLGATAILAEYWRIRTRDRAPEIWDSFMQAKSPVLLCLGTHNISGASTQSALETEDVVMRMDTIPIDDAAVIASTAGLLGSLGIPFRVVAADKTSPTDLQIQPVILVGAVDNKWTLQLTQALRYRISVTYPRGPAAPPTASIVDAEQPGGSSWKTDFSVPLSAWKYDYAIVAKENDPTIGVPVLMEAGLGNAGSLAASEMVTSGNLAAVLKNNRSCREKSNFEVVIRTEVIDTSPGPPHPIRIACW